MVFQKRLSNKRQIRGILLYIQQKTSYNLSQFNIHETLIINTGNKKAGGTCKSVSSNNQARLIPHCGKIKEEHYVFNKFRKRSEI